MKKLTGIFLTAMLCLGFQTAQASTINKAISDSGINKGAVAISVKDISTGKTVYQLNSKVPMNPASTQKILTYTASLDTLGKDYNFTTNLYTNNKNELFLQLGGDPYFSSRDLRELVKSAKNKKIIEPKAFYIDDYIMDSVEWGEGWQWDDELNILMPKFSSYNIDNNIMTVVIRPTQEGSPAKIIPDVFYPLTFMNLVTTGKEDFVNVSRAEDIAPDVLKVEGTVRTQVNIKIPVKYPKRYFIFRLEDSIKEAKMEYYGQFKQAKTPIQNVYLIDKIKHPIEKASEDVLKNSNNFIAETVFKIAGAKFVNNTGSLKNSQSMLEDYLKRLGLKTDDIRIVDGSGVSKNNLVTADFMTDFLIAQTRRNDFDEYKKLLPTSGEGTMTDRMLYFKDNIYAKTGTLSNISAITGYIKSKNGKTYAFDIMINDAKSSSSDKKMLEEYILRAVYNCY